MKYLYLLVCVLVVTVGTVAFGVNEQDWLNDAFEESHEAAQDPYATDIEADDLFETSLGAGVGSNGVTAGTMDSVLVRFTRFLLRIVVILAVPMLLYGGIRVILSFGDQSKFNKALKILLNIALGVLLALASVMIIYLVIALTRSSLNFFG